MLQIRFDTNKSIDECSRLQVVSFCKDEVFPRYESEIHASQQAIRDYLKAKTFGEKDAKFNIGYSCRMESVLSESTFLQRPCMFISKAGKVWSGVSA